MTLTRRRRIVRLTAGLVLVATGLFFAVSWIRSSTEERAKRQICETNLVEIGGVWNAWIADSPDALPYGGAEMMLYWCKKRRLPCDNLVCPGDESVLDAVPNELPEYDNIETGPFPMPPCSYAGRDFERFPPAPDSRAPQILACDRGGNDGRTPHHKDGLHVLFTDGTVTFYDRDALGLRPDDPIVVGPDSDHPMLRMVFYDRTRRR